MKTDDLLNTITAQAVESRRVFISRFFYEKFQGKIQRGPLAGFKLDDDPSWGPGDVAAKLFGLYEQEVLSIVEGLIGRKHVLVNLGGVPYIESTRLGTLIAAHTTASRQGGALKLLNLTTRLQEILTSSKLLNVFDCFDDEETAVRSFSAPV